MHGSMQKGFVVVYVCFNMFFFFYFLLVWLCKFHSIGPEIKSYTVPSLSFFIFKLDSSVCDISLFSTLVYYLTGSLNFASELAFKARVE